MAFWLEMFVILEFKQIYTNSFQNFFDDLW